MTVEKYSRAMCNLDKPNNWSHKILGCFKPRDGPVPKSLIPTLGKFRCQAKFSSLDLSLLKSGKVKIPRVVCIFHSDLGKITIMVPWQSCIATIVCVYTLILFNSPIQVEHTWKIVLFTGYPMFIWTAVSFQKNSSGGRGVKLSAY